MVRMIMMMSLMMMMMTGNGVVFCIRCGGWVCRMGRLGHSSSSFRRTAHAAHPRPAQSLFSAFFPQMGAVPALCRGCTSTSVEAPSCYYCCPRPRPQGVRVHLVGGWVGEYMERVHLSNSELCGCYRWPRGVRHDDTRHLSDPSCSGNVGLA